jgi:hypothetical protein
MRTNLYTSPSHTEAFSQIGMLEALYLKTFGRKTSIDLFMSSQFADGVRTMYGVTAYHEGTPAALDEVEWMKTVLP